MLDPKHHINLFRILFDPEVIQIIPSEEGDALLIQARGGDGGGSYLVSLVLRKNGKHKQYDWMYCEGGLPPFPYEVEYLAGEQDGNPVIKSFNWLKPKPEQGADGKTPETP